MGLGVRTGILTNIYQLYDFERDVLNLARIFIFVKLEKICLIVELSGLNEAVNKQTLAWCRFSTNVTFTYMDLEGKGLEII